MTNIDIFSGFHAYVMAGAEADYNVKNDTEEEGVKKEENASPT